jgi:hypothetical protein
MDVIAVDRASVNDHFVPPSCFANSPWRHGPWLQELDNEARNTLASVDDARIPGLAVMWANIEEFKGHARVESMVTLITDLVGLARRARDAGDHLYCWSSL